MTPQELKNSILQLAIQGKLVPQRAEEGTAEELKQILLKEKQKLISLGKILKKGKTKPFWTQDEINDFYLPKSWEWVQLSDVSIIQEGAGIRKWQYRDKGVQILCVTNILEDKIDLDKKKLFISNEEYLEKYTHLKLNKGDIVTSCSGGSWGKIAVFNSDKTLMLNTSTLRMRFFSDLAYNKYLYYVCKSQFFKSQLEKQLSGMQPNFGYAHYSRIMFPLPPLAEQKRIVAKIEELLPYVERYEKAYNELQQLNKRFPGDLQKSVLQLAIQGRLVSQCPEEGNAEDLYKQIQAEKKNLIQAGKIKKEKPLPTITDDEKPFEIPESWKWVRFNELCAVLTCGYASTPEYVSKDIGMPFISAKNVKPYKFMPEDHKYIKRELYERLIQNAKPEKGDILLTRVGAGIGEAAIIDKDIDFAIYVSLSLIKLINYNLIYNKYILFWLNSPIGITSAKSNIYGKNASQGNLNVKNVREFLVPLPPFAEQKRIVAKLEEILPLCNKMK